MTDDEAAGGTEPPRNLERGLSYVEYTPTLRDRIARRLGYRRQHVECMDSINRPYWFKIDIRAWLPFSERLRVLLSGRVSVTVSCASATPVEDLVSKGETWADRPRWLDNRESS